jgi:Domain of unknown function (DUF5667)
MPRPKPNKLHDELDALLDGRPVELTDELAPLAEAADALRVELAAYQLDPAVADRHLERVLHGSASVVQLPLRAEPNGWDLRRRLAAVALAAALVLAPATMASAAALPGQAMYPFKLAIEQLRIASVQWSSGREAVERTRVADARLEEVQRLVDLQMFSQLPTALKALERAVTAAKAAVEEAKQEGEPVAKVEQKLNQVAVAGGQVAQVVRVAATAAAAQGMVPLSGDTLRAIQTAVDQSQDVLPPPEASPAGATATPTTTLEQPAQGPESTTGATQTSGTAPEQSTTTEGTTTTEATTTTQAPTTTTSPSSEDTATPGSVGGGTGGAGDQAGAEERTPAEDLPQTTLAPPAT